MLPTSNESLSLTEYKSPQLDAITTSTSNEYSTVVMLCNEAAQNAFSKVIEAIQKTDKRQIEGFAFFGEQILANQADILQTKSEIKETEKSIMALVEARFEAMQQQIELLQKQNERSEREKQELKDKLAMLEKSQPTPDQTNNIQLTLEQIKATQIIEKKALNDCLDLQQIKIQSLEDQSVTTNKDIVDLKKDVKANITKTSELLNHCNKNFVALSTRTTEILNHCNNNFAALRAWFK